MRNSRVKPAVTVTIVGVVMFGAFSCGGTKDGERIETYEQPLVSVAVVQDGDNAFASASHLPAECRPPVTFWGECEVVDCAAMQACEAEAIAIEILDDAGTTASLTGEPGSSVSLNELSLDGKIEIAGSSPDFSKKLKMPQTALALSAPADLADHDIAQPLEITWDKGERGDDVLVTLTDGAFCPAIRCRFDARKGLGEVPSEALAAIEGANVQWSASVERHAELARDGADVELTTTRGGVAGRSLTLVGEVAADDAAE